MANINLGPIENAQGYPPVATWSPPFCGDMDLTITSRGDWVHEGSVIKREKLVVLFSRILWREGDEYFLVTPSEKVRIRVEDAPFHIIQYTQEESEAGVAVIRFVTRTNDVLVLGEGCQMRLFECRGELLPYVSVRHNMWASFHRNVYYQLIEEGVLKNDELIIQSAGTEHTLGVLVDR